MNLFRITLTSVLIRAIYFLAHLYKEIWSTYRIFERLIFEELSPKCCSWEATPPVALYLGRPAPVALYLGRPPGGFVCWMRRLGNVEPNRKLKEILEELFPKCWILGGHAPSGFVSWEASPSGFVSWEATRWLCLLLEELFPKCWILGGHAPSGFVSWEASPSGFVSWEATRWLSMLDEEAWHRITE